MIFVDPNGKDYELTKAWATGGLAAIVAGGGPEDPTGDIVYVGGLAVFGTAETVTTYGGQLLDMFNSALTLMTNIHNNTVVNHIVPAEYDKTQVENSFSGWISQKTLSESMVVYQYTTMGSTGSPYFTTNGNLTPDEARQLLALPDSNTAVTVTQYIIPEGTTVLEGNASSMVGEDGFGDYATGGGTQIYLADPSVAQYAGGNN